MLRRIAITIVTLLIIGLGVNFVALFMHRNAIVNGLQDLKEKLETAGITLKYDGVDFASFCATSVKAKIINPSFEYKSTQSVTTTTLNTIILVSKPLDQEMNITTNSNIREVVMSGDQKMVDLVYALKEPRIDIKFNNSFESILAAIKQNKGKMLNTVKEVSYIDQGMIAYDEIADNKFLLQYDGASATILNKIQKTKQKSESERMDFNIQAGVASCRYNPDHPDPKVQQMATAGNTTIALDFDYFLGMPSEGNEYNKAKYDDKKSYDCFDFKKLNIINSLFSLTINGMAGYNITNNRPIMEGEIVIHELPAFVKFYSKLFNLMMMDFAKNAGANAIMIDDDKASEIISLLEKLAEAEKNPGRSTFIVSSNDEDSKYEIRISGKSAIDIFSQITNIMMRPSL